MPVTFAIEIGRFVSWGWALRGCLAPDCVPGPAIASVGVLDPLLDNRGEIAGEDYVALQHAFRKTSSY
jgi:hypothetical protein